MTWSCIQYSAPSTSSYDDGDDDDDDDDDDHDDDDDSMTTTTMMMMTMMMTVLGNVTESVGSHFVELLTVWIVVLAWVYTPFL
jgi:hypothetical protein